MKFTVEVVSSVGSRVGCFAVLCVGVSEVKFGGEL